MAIYGYVTAVYNSKTGESTPSADPTTAYFVSSTTWNTDATSQIVGSGHYTDSSGHFKRVKPSFYIPQYITEIDDNFNKVMDELNLIKDDLKQSHEENEELKQEILELKELVKGKDD